jgi:membrane protease YdiL (CAAX protease family)
MAVIAPSAGGSAGLPAPLSPGGAATYLFSTLGGLGPLLALVILQRMTSGQVQVRVVLGQMRIREAFREPVTRTLAALAILGWPLVTVLGSLLAALAGQEARLVPLTPGPDDLGLAALPVMLIHFAVALWTSPLFEEPCWRGFALSRLQGRLGRASGSAVVALLWWLWHQPINLTFGMRPTLHSLASMATLSFVIDSLYNLSGGNLWVAMLAHQSAGTVNTFLYQGEGNLWALALKIALVAALRRLEARRGAQTRQVSRT